MGTLTDFPPHSMRGNFEQKWRVDLESANKKCLANKLAQLYDSGKSQPLKIVPQPTRHFCWEFPRIGYEDCAIC